MKQFSLASAAVLCLVFAVCGVVITSHLSGALDSWASVPNVLENQSILTRRDLNQHLATLETDLILEIDRTRQDINTHLKVAESDTVDILRKQGDSLDSRLMDVTQAVSSRLLDLNASINSGVSLTDSHFSQIQDQLLKDEPMIFSRYLATTGELNKTLDAMRRFSESWAKAAPDLTDSAVKVSDNVVEITSNVKAYTKPEGFLHALKWAPLRIIHVNVGKP